MSCTYKEIIDILNKAERVADGALATAEFVHEEFEKRYPLIYIGRPSRFLETARRIAGPIRSQKLKGLTQKSYLKREWKSRIRNVTTKCQGNNYNYVASYVFV